MIGIVIVSHSPKVAEGVKDLADQMSQKRVKVVAAGGVDDQTIGTNAERIYNALLEAYSDDGVLVLLDLGSAVMSAQMAIEMLPEDKQNKVVLSEAPLVEGAIVAAVEASIGNDLAKVNAAAEAASTMRKLP
ncbi:MAG TPA: PTS-dependent dihydroxyacetone kinase phosphotransferase subunit DhaM [Chloroflexi bacterium]|nr:PTS-dependent dihydroxyacetone kinase phosphotransferase subunit DhaM [Chloroflexota bacterium]